MSYFFDKRLTNVFGIYGHLGGGKTLTAVDIMVEFLRDGFEVVSNVQLYNIENLPGRYTFLEDFHEVDFWSLPCGAPRGSNSPYRSLIVIDEAAEFLDQYSSNSPVVKSFLSWLRHSSKRGQFVILIIQRPEFLVKSCRLLVNRWILCDDMAQIKLPYLRINNPFCRGYVRRLMFDRLGNLISRGLNLLNKKEIGKYYNTAQSIATEGKQVNTIDYKPPPPDWITPFLIFFFFFFLLKIGFSIYGYFVSYS